MRDLINSTTPKNYKTWHEKNPGWFLHHGLLKRGIYKCCPFFWVKTKDPEHQLNWAWVEKHRERLTPYKTIVEANYVKGLGCWDKTVFKECSWCKMPRVEAK